jgi:polysaccharide export outer membrane protein
MKTRLLRSVACPVVIGLILAGVGPASAQVTNYVVGPQDVLTITVFDQRDLDGKYTVEADGTFTFPLIGRVKAGGLTLRSVEAELRKQLANGFFKNPQVSVAVEQYRSQRIFVVGEVHNPGAYALTGDMTLIEALARAGSTTEAAAGQALVVRPKAGRAVGGPVMPNQDDSAEVVRVDIKELQNGKLSQNATLQDNDTVFIPRAESIFVFGQVKNPGSYALQRGMTVLQALSLAGGVNDRGATGRIKIVRVVAGKQEDVKAKLEDIVQPGDTVIVPEKFF